MSEFSVKVDDLSKRYRIGLQERRRDTLGMSLVDFVGRPVRNLKRLRGLSRFREDEARAEDIIWALKDVSFEIGAGEVVGVIGANGAGKSTLLKILARITEPTVGQIATRGRVSSLLEVGTGFHPELTGRENVYLNGTVLGMTRKEISSRFDEIIDFSGVERFLDTPVKRYSSGMRVRLAFAVAAHLEPEILLVDEVLSVGDAAFQQKCLGKMQSVATEGRTVIFVSHNMGAVQRLCTRGILLREGSVVRDGGTDEAIDEYLGGGIERQAGEKNWPDLVSAPGDDSVRLLRICAKDSKGRISSRFQVTDPITLEFEYEVLNEGHQLGALLDFTTPLGERVMRAFDGYVDRPWGGQPTAPVGRYVSRCLIPGNLLNAGDLLLNLLIYSPPYRPYESPHVAELETLRISVADNMDPSGARGYYPHDWGPAAVRPRLEWQKEALTADEPARPGDPLEVEPGRAPEPDDIDLMPVPQRAGTGNVGDLP